MTLNITVLTERTIYVSADFRLTDLKTGALVSDSSDKTIVLVYESWAGVVTYTGIGSLTSGQSVADVVATWLTGVHDPTMEELVELIRDRGSKWFAWLSGMPRPIKHTFVVAGFVASRPRAYVISNFEAWHGVEREVGREFSISSVSSRRGTTVLITGCKSAVPRAARKALERAIDRHGGEPALIRQRLQEANRTAAASAQSNNVVSPECSVYSFDALGHGRSERANDVPGMGRCLLDGIDLTAITMRVAKEILGTDRVSGRLLVSGRGGAGPPVMEAPCNASFVTPERSGYSVRDLGTPGGNSICARAINNQGQIVGEGDLVPGGPPVPWMWGAGSWNRLPIPPNSFGYAKAINDLGEVVGGCVTPLSVTPGSGGLEHAWFWGISGESTDLDGRVDHESSARALNAKSQIVGRFRRGYRRHDTLPGRGAVHRVGPDRHGQRPGGRVYRSRQPNPRDLGTDNEQDGAESVWPSPIEA